MNKIKAEVKNIQKSGEVALIKLESMADRSHIFSSVILNYNNRVVENLQCNVIFKENDVMICDKNYTHISARNRFISIIKDIEIDSIFARIYFSFEDTIITSLITKDAAQALGLIKGKTFGWFVKSNNIMLEF